MTESITSNVKDFASHLAGEKFLNAPRFPEVTFVSTAFRQTDATSGKVDGNLTLMGKTAPITFDVTLVGAGKGFGAAAPRRPCQQLDQAAGLRHAGDVLRGHRNRHRRRVRAEPMNVMVKPAGSELVLTRDIAASRERLFAAWSDIRQASIWWAPRDFTLLSCEMDVRPGGVWRRRMRSPERRRDPEVRHLSRGRAA